MTGLKLAVEDGAQNLALGFCIYFHWPAPDDDEIHAANVRGEN